GHAVVGLREPQRMTECRDERLLLERSDEQPPVVWEGPGHEFEGVPHGQLTELHVRTLSRAMQAGWSSCYKRVTRVFCDMNRTSAARRRVRLQHWWDRLVRGRCPADTSTASGATASSRMRASVSGELLFVPGGIEQMTYVEVTGATPVTD